MSWNLCSNKMPPEPAKRGDRIKYLVTVNANKPTTLFMEYVKTTVRGKIVCRWEWNGRISPWEVIAWTEMPSPFTSDQNENNLTAAEELKNAISGFCRARINMGLCSDDQCEFCPVNDCYSYAENFANCENEEDD